MRKESADLVHVERNVWSNAAGLEWLKRHRANLDPYSRIRCEPNPAFICPFAKRGEGMPCLDPGRNKKLLAKIGEWNWKQINVPIGQMSLFEPKRTHKVCWINTKNGEVVDKHPSPAYAMVSCKHMAVAHVKWMEKNGWNPDAWRIIPLDDSNEWREAMIEKHGFRACVFDVL